MPRSDPAETRWADLLTQLGNGSAPNWERAAHEELDVVLTALEAVSMLTPGQLETAREHASRLDPDWRARAAARLHLDPAGVPGQWRVLWNLLRLAQPISQRPPTLAELADRARAGRARDLNHASEVLR